jgi:hypothetical protein
MESRIQEAVAYIGDNPEAKIATVAREFGVSRGRLRSRIEGYLPKKGLPAANKRLSDPEEKALCLYIDRLDRINLSVRPEFITSAANYILKERASKSILEEPPLVGPNWTTRFIQRHRYFKQRQKKMNSDRQSSENIPRVQEYFKQLQEVCAKEGITPDDIWNMDETGFRIGVGKDQLIVTKRKRAHYFGIPENRESATAIEAISAGGQYIPAFLILSGQLHMAHWYQQPELEPETAITPSTSGYSNDQISLQWLEHFNRHTKEKTIGAKRLLIVDGHGSHHTMEFIQYCEDNNIIPFGMPPNLTHILQPLDVVVFQPLKHYHAKALDILVRDGVINITKIEFLSIIQDIRRKAFKKESILSAFKKTGIWPFNPQPIIEELHKRQPERTPTPPPQLFSSPFSTPITIRQINKVADKLENTLQEDNTIDPEFAEDISRFIRGSLTNVTELVQTKRDLGRTKYAEQVQRRRRALKNTPLQSGGVLTVAQGRRMVQQREEDQLAKARRVVEAAELKAHNARKRCFFEAAKEARKWRLLGKLLPAEVSESGVGCRLLKRF